MIDLEKYRCTRRGFVMLPTVVKKIRKEAEYIDPESANFLVRAANEAVSYGMDRDHALVVAYLIGFTVNERPI